MNSDEIRKLAQSFQLLNEEGKEIELLRRHLDQSWAINRLEEIGGQIPDSLSSVKQRILGNPKTVDEAVLQLSHLSQGGMDNIFYCIKRVLKNNIPGDFVEAGVWRGGSCIFARMVFDEYAAKDRNIWACDSFEGFPEDTIDFDKYKLLDFYKDIYGVTSPRELNIVVPPPSLDEVREHFQSFNILDDRIKFIKGWFSDTMPNLAVDKVAILRLDGDMYQSTMDVLTNVYKKVSKGGYVIVDDYGAIFQGCVDAIHEFRENNNILDPLTKIGIDGDGVYWRVT